MTQRFPDQLWSRRTAGMVPIEEAKFVPAKNRAYPFVKPEIQTGLWTSTFDPIYGSEWIQWCLSEEFECDRSDPVWHSAYLLTPRVDARIYEIDTYDDLQALVDKHCAKADYGHRYRVAGIEPTPYDDCYIDYESAAKEYDGIHLTDAGQWATRLSHPLNLYGWDCESTLWLNWAFESVKSIGSLPVQPAKDAWWLEEEEVA